MSVVATSWLVKSYPVQPAAWTSDAARCARPAATDSSIGMDGFKRDRCDAMCLHTPTRPMTHAEPLSPAGFAWKALDPAGVLWSGTLLVGSQCIMMCGNALARCEFAIAIALFRNNGRHRGIR